MPRERIKTYIDGFDKYLGGGIPKGHIVLIAGAAGTMKSSVAYNILYHNALENDMHGAYISLEQDAESLLDHMEGLGLSHELVKNKVWIIDLSQTRLETEDYGLKRGWSFIIKDTIESLKKDKKIELLVLDSLNVYETMCQADDPRVELFELFRWLKGLDLTAFLISEMSLDSKEYAKYGADFLADGIIHLTLDTIDDVHSSRRIKCVKMRGTAHSTDYFALIFGGTKFRIPIGIADVWR